MKKALLLASIVLFAFQWATPSHATGYTPPADPGLQQSQDQWQKQQQAQQSSSSVGNVSAQGTGKASAGGGNANINDADKSSTRVYVAPPPSSTQVPQATGCIVTKSLAGSIGWTFVSASGTEQYSDWVCTNLNMAVAEYSVCHYKNADAIRVETYNRLNPTSTPLTVSSREENLTASECSKTKPLNLNSLIENQPPAAGKIAEHLAPKKACANPKRFDVPCARPGGIRKDDGCCYYSCAGK